VNVARAIVSAAYAACLLALLATLSLLPFGAAAEPYLAVESGLKCANCHVNPSGGGKRTLFGTLYARTQISSRALELRDNSKPWTGEINRWFAIGGDFRGGYDSVDIPGTGKQSDVDISRATFYAQVRAIPDLLSLYVDEKLAPDNVLNREAYLLLTPKRGKYTVKAGQFFLPFGLRLQDDNAFVRQSSGINFNTPDDGVELGLELAKWSAQLAVSKGAGGGDTNGSANRVSLSAAYVQPRWRVGASYNKNDDPLGDREMQGVFAGWRTGPISWLAELDFIKDELTVGDRPVYATLIEGNWRVRKGHNLKLTYEYLDPDRNRAEDQQEKYSLLWEYSPIQFVQARIGLRAYNGIPNFPTSNRDQVFAELHVYF
jgi:hypothetical protein